MLHLIVSRASLSGVLDPSFYIISISKLSFSPYSQWQELWASSSICHAGAVIIILVPAVFPCLVSAAWGIHRASCLWGHLSDVLTLICFVFLVVLRLSSPLPPLFYFLYSFRVLNLGCNDLCIVSCFHVLILSFLSSGFFLLWPIYYTSRVSGDWLGVGVYCLEFFGVSFCSGDFILFLTL